ncbi:MAG: helix-turn-helix domain-containing protein [Hormoscilla sp.]
MRKPQQKLSYLERKNRAEILAKIGARLRQLREENSISIEMMADKTGINQRQIRAIESGQLEQLPEPIYIQYFIKRYAEALGLNGAEEASAFPAGDFFRPINPAWIHLPAPILRPIHLYVVYILVVLFSVSSLSYLMRHSLNSERLLYVQQPVKTPSPSASNDSTTVPHRPEPVRVNMTIDADSWLWIEADGQTEFEGILPKGSERTWVANQQLIIRAGNAGGVRIALNDELPQKLGEPNAVEEVTFKAPPRSRI